MNWDDDDEDDGADAAVEAIFMLTIYKNTTKAYDSQPECEGCAALRLWLKSFSVHWKCGSNVDQTYNVTHPTTFWSEHFACFTTHKMLIPFNASTSMCAFYVVDVCVQQTHLKRLFLWLWFTVCTKMNLWSGASNTYKSKTATTHILWISLCEQLTP